MAVRPVFVPFEKAPYVHAIPTKFVWNKGLSVSQKQKNIKAIHDSFAKSFPNRNILEISSKSLQEIGICLSAFNLRKYVPSIEKSIPVECVYHGGKMFSEGGPFTDLYNLSPKEAKMDPRLQSSGPLCGFYFEGESMPLNPKTAFYNWTYINALIENPEYSQQLLKFDAFTDIEFAPDKSVSCQAEAAAVFVSLHRYGLLDRCKSFESFRSLVL